MSEPIGQLNDNRNEYRIYFRRIIFSALIVLFLAVIIVARFYNLQITEYEDHITQSERNRIHRLPVPATRGLVYDRNGELLADNRPTYSLTIVKERVKDLGYSLDALKELVDISDQQIEKFKKQPSIPFQSVPLKYNLTEEEIAIIGVNRYKFPGVEVEAGLVRYYPLAELFAHVVGYVGRINEKELEKINPDAYRGMDSMGKTGIEKVYENRLLGTVGYQNVETNARGRIIKVINRIDPVPGNNLHLYLDRRIQQVAYDALAGQRAAVVAIEVETGGVVVDVSTPSFNSNLFVTGISVKDYTALRDSADIPLYNRAIQGQYPPGSTIKPVLGLAGLDSEVINESSHISDPGWYRLENDDRKYRDWKKGGHGGSVDLHMAITQSCDVFFYSLAFKLGIDRMSSFLTKFGIGKLTQVDQTSERGGLMPSREWKRNAMGYGWYPGETLNTGIGQGYMLTTPMQLAEMTAIIAARGERIEPRILKSVDDGEDLAPVKQEPIVLKNPAHWDYMFKSMEDVVHSARGTAHQIAKGASYRMAGKTGTAQVVGMAQDVKYDITKVAKRRRDHALFIAFAPVDNPKLALAIVVENGEHGSTTAAPVARKIFDAYLLGQDQHENVPPLPGTAN